MKGWNFGEFLKFNRKGCNIIVKKFTADFETATWLENETYVWAWATCEIGNENNLVIKTDMNEFIEYCKSQKNATFYFHNLPKI